MSNSTKGVLYKFKQNRTKLWEWLCELMLSGSNWLVTRPMKGPSWGYFYLHTTTSQYIMMTADNCCCGSGCVPAHHPLIQHLNTALDTPNSQPLPRHLPRAWVRELRRNEAVGEGRQRRDLPPVKRRNQDRRPTLFGSG